MTISWVAEEKPSRTAARAIRVRLAGSCAGSIEAIAQNGRNDKQLGDEQPGPSSAQHSGEKRQGQKIDDRCPEKLKGIAQGPPN